MRFIAPIVLAASPAFAQPRPDGKSVAVVIGAGVAWSDTHSDNYPAYQGHGDHTSGVHVRIDAGYRLDARVAVGLHAGVARVDGTTQGYDIDTEWFTYTSYELGVGAIVASNRLWAAPWIGINKLANTHGLLLFVDDVTVAGGLAVGVDLVVSDAHAFAIFLDAMLAPKDDETFQSIGLGVAYHY